MNLCAVQALEKSVRALRKKMRQAEALVEKQGTGAKLTAEETEKAGKLTGWWVGLSIWLQCCIGFVCALCSAGFKAQVLDYGGA